MYETIPFFSGRSTLEGVYNQASLQTHPVYYLASELFASSPEPVPEPHLLALRPRARDPAAAPASNVSDIVALSDPLKSDARPPVPTPAS